MLPHGFQPGTPGPEGPGGGGIFGPQAPQSHHRGRSTPEERAHALHLLASGMQIGQVAASLGRSAEAIRQWRARATQEGTLPASPAAAASPPATSQDPVPAESGSTSPGSTPSSPSVPQVPQRAPKDPGAGLGEHEVEAILDLKRKFPSMGPAQIRAQLKRFKGWRVGVRPIKRVLERHGFETVHVGSRPKGEEEPRSWEAPHRNAIWQLDFADLRVGPERVALLVVIDDFSRFVVGHQVMTSATSEAVVDVLGEAIRRHGKPEAIYTDRGSPFLAWNKKSALGRFLEEETIDHHVSPAYRPQGRGKVEAFIHTFQRELWHVEHFDSIEAARQSTRRFVDRYNHRRAHLGIDGLTPADRFFGRWEEVLARVQAVSRQRQGISLNGEGGDLGSVSQEVLGEDGIEVLRLLVVGGRMELRFFGHRVDLGEVKP